MFEYSARFLTPRGFLWFLVSFLWDITGVIGFVVSLPCIFICVF